MHETEDVLSEIAVFLARRKISETTFGRLAADNTRLLARLRAGTASLATLAKARQYIERERAKEAAQ